MLLTDSQITRGTVPLRGNVALARNLHTRHSNARYPKLDYSRVTIEDKTLESLIT